MNRLRLSTRLSIAIACCAPIVTARVARAQSFDPRVLCTGEPFVFAGGPGQRAAVLAAIDQSTASMNFIARPIARGRLRERSAVWERIVIRCTGGAIDITVPQRPLFHSPETGASIQWRGPDGQMYLLKQRFVANGILQEVGNIDGSRSNTYTTTADGRTLTLTVRIVSGRLPRPIQYALSYRR
jgi:hypothetical protein